MERSDCDRHLSVQADCLAGRAESLLDESIEALLFVPDLDDSESEIGGSGQMQVDTALGSGLDPSSSMTARYSGAVKPWTSSVETTLMSGSFRVACGVSASDDGRRRTTG
jgi:hypothetical protein